MDNNVSHAADRLEFLVKIIPPLLQTISENQFSLHPRPGKWSKKEILGHLIDSATINHHRFIRAQIEDEPLIQYNQDEWNRIGAYQRIHTELLIRLWKEYNALLVHVIRHIPTAHFNRHCRVGNETFTLSFLVADYVLHLEHHLHQITQYD